jgi:hypothetical protein
MRITEMRGAIRSRAIERRMARRQLASTRRLSHDAAPLRIADPDHGPLSALILQRVPHHHSMTHSCVTLRMKGNGRVRLIFVERYSRGGHVKRVHVQAGPALDALEDCGLHLFFAFHVISTACKHKEGKRKRQEWT